MKKILIITGSAIGTLVLLFLTYWFLVPGSLSISTNVNSAKILLDGQKIGAGNVNKSLKRGLYVVMIQNDQYISQTKTFQIYGLQKKSFTFELKKLPTPLVIKKNVTGFSRDKNLQNLLITQNDGKEFVKLDPATNSEELLSRVNFGQAIKSKWSPNNFLAYIWRTDGSSGLVDLKRYDLLNQEFLLGKKGVLDVIWNTGGEEVAYAYKPGDGEFSLVKSLPNGENMERLFFHLEKVGIKNPTIEWTKDGKDLILIDDNIFVYNFYSHNLTKITKNDDLKWARLSSNGKYIVFSNSEGTYLCKLDGTVVKNLGETLDSFEWLPNGQEIIGFSKGEFRKINVQNGSITSYGYNGSRMKNITGLTMLKGSDVVYYLTKNNLMKLTLQTKVIELS